MGTDMMDRVPEVLRAQYAEDLGPAPFTVDDVVVSGRRRQRRRTAVTVGAALVAVAATGGAVASGVLGGAGTADQGVVRPAGVPSAGTGTDAGPAPTYPGCTDRPATCAALVAAWSREVTGSTAPVRALDAAAYEPGALVLEQQVSSVPGQRDVYVSVVVAPTSTDAEGMVKPSPGPEPMTLPGVPGRVDRLTRNGGGNLGESYDLPAARFGRALRVEINVANQGPVGGPFSETADDVPAPGWWNEADVADLVTRIYGTAVVTGAQSPGASSSGSATH